MKRISVLLILILVVDGSLVGQSNSDKTLATPLPFSTVILKKVNQGKICDSCAIDFAFVAEPNFSYLITGTGHTPNRFRQHIRKIKDAYKKSDSKVHTFLVSSGHIGFNFLPNYSMENGKRVQIWKNFGSVAYNELEVQIKQNNKVIKHWQPVFSLGEDKDYKIMGVPEGLPLRKPSLWKPTFHVGAFDLKVNDSLFITIRKISNKGIFAQIKILRVMDKANDFIYYQIPVKDDRLATNLQQILNIESESLKAYRGDTIEVLEKDYDAIGILRFGELSKNDGLEYSFGNKPYKWQSASTKDPLTGIFLVLPMDMAAEKDHQLFLRYKTQPETIHMLTVKVKDSPFQFPWLYTLIGFVLILAIGIILFYLKERKNRRKMLALNRKNKDTELQLALLSGQLNPHFLFNTLNAIQGTINSNSPDNANNYIGNVAKFMRNVMDSGRKEFISLSEELKLEEDYLRLEQQRKIFSFTVILTDQIEPSLIDFPPLLLQPVLENSIRHAFASEFASPKLEIRINKLESNLIITVIDNGQVSWDTNSVSEGHGLSLTRKRMAVYNAKLKPMVIFMEMKYISKKGTITTFTLQNWLT